MVRDKIIKIRRCFLGKFIIFPLAMMGVSVVYALGEEQAQPLTSTTSTSTDESEFQAKGNEAGYEMLSPSGHQVLLEQSCPVDSLDYFSESVDIKQDSLFKKSIDWLVDSRDLVSEGLVDVAEDMDFYFVSDEVVDEANGTYFKLSLSQRFDKGGELTIEEKVKLKLDLPRTQNRLKIVFESNPDDLDSLEDRNRNIPIEEVRIGDDSGATGAVSFMLYEGKFWEVDPRIGLKGPDPLDPFVLLKLKRDQHLEDDWRVRFRQSFYYYHGDGFGERSQLYFERPITESYFFRNKLEAQWQDEYNRFEFAEVFSTTHTLDRKHSVNYAMGIVGESKSIPADDEQRTGPRVTSYFLRTTLRKLLYRDWLYVSFTPDLYFPRTENFSFTPSFTIRLDIIFSDQRTND